MSYYDDDDELDIRLRHGGRASPGGIIYAERRPSGPPRPVYYRHGQGGSSYLVPEHVTTLRRTQSTGQRRRTPPPQAPVIINNRIYNEYDDYSSDDLVDDERYLALSRRPRSRSRSRPSSFAANRDDYGLQKTLLEIEALEREKRVREEEKRIRDDEKRWRADQKRKDSESHEVEKMRKELEAYRLEAEKEREDARLKKEMELKILVEERRQAEERNRLKKQADEAVEKWKVEEAARLAREKKERDEKEKEFQRRLQEAKEREAAAAAKAKKEQEEKEAEYQRRLQEDLRKSGVDERQIGIITKKEKPADPNRPTYTRMSRKHLSIETLNRFRIDYEFDSNPDYLLIKRWVPEYEQDFLWSHTRDIREKRQPVFVAIEDRKKKHHDEVDIEWVRKKDKKAAPSTLLTWVSGSRR